MYAVVGTAAFRLKLKDLRADARLSLVVVCTAAAGWLCANVVDTLFPAVGRSATLAHGLLVFLVVSAPWGLVHRAHRARSSRLSWISA
jgi:hypothetical protein